MAARPSVSARGVLGETAPLKEGSVAEWSARWTCNPEIPSSSPALAATQMDLFPGNAEFQLLLTTLVHSQLVCLLPVGFLNFLNLWAVDT